MSTVVRPKRGELRPVFDYYHIINNTIYWTDAHIMFYCRNIDSEDRHIPVKNTKGLWDGKNLPLFENVIPDYKDIYELSFSPGKAELSELKALSKLFKYCTISKENTTFELFTYLNSETYPPYTIPNSLLSIKCYDDITPFKIDIKYLTMLATLVEKNFRGAEITFGYSNTPTKAITFKVGIIQGVLMPCQ